MSEDEADAQQMAAEPSPALERDEAGLGLLLEYLHRSRGFDFGGYKRATLARRIQRRMQTLALVSYSDYLDYLQVHPDEFPQLFNVILINVTSFFRDAEAWEVLGTHVASMLGDKEHNAPVRVWSAGCASGEEAYTFAMVLAELLGRDAFSQRVKIYATDLDEEALAQARVATYPPKSVEGVPPQLLEKYFAPAGQSFAFDKDLRRAVIFGRHDLLRDAPISRVDILSCRNTLMYFNAETQAQILGRLHFALASKGLFFLGKAEMLLTHGSLFTPIDLKLRLFRRNARGGSGERQAGQRVTPASLPAANEEATSLRRAAFDANPLAQIILDAEGRVALANHRATSLFSLVNRDIGRPFHELELSYRPVELRSVIDRVRSERRVVNLKEIERSTGPLGKSYLDIEVAPLRMDSGEMLGVHISFADSTTAHNLQSQLNAASLELVSAHQELQSTSEELETTTEELQSTVEELETTNEELQATNEELETMNEELQSTNEELQTLNEELRERGEALNESNTFLGTILESLHCGVAVLDRDLLVKSWNRQMTELWGVRPDEVEGRHLLSLDIGLPTEELRGPLREAVAADEARSFEHFVDCTNRRGKAIKCRVGVSPLRGGTLKGALMMVEEVTR